MVGNCLSWLDDVERRFAVVTPLHLPMIAPDVLVCRQAAGLDSLSPRWEYYSLLCSTRPASLSLSLSPSLFYSSLLILPKSNLRNFNKELEKCSRRPNRCYDFLVLFPDGPDIINPFSFDMSEYVFHFLYFLFSSHNAMAKLGGDVYFYQIYSSSIKL